MSKFRVGDCIVSDGLFSDRNNGVIVGSGDEMYEIEWTDHHPTSQSHGFTDKYFSLDEVSIAKRIIESYE